LLEIVVDLPLYSQDSLDNPSRNTCRRRVQATLLNQAPDGGRVRWEMPGVDRFLYKRMMK
jgi:hypothetical protein